MRKEAFHSIDHEPRKHFDHIVKYAGLTMITESQPRPAKVEKTGRLFLDDLKP